MKLRPSFAVVQEGSLAVAATFWSWLGSAPVVALGTSVKTGTVEGGQEVLLLVAWLLLHGRSLRRGRVLVGFVAVAICGGLRFGIQAMPAVASVLRTWHWGAAQTLVWTVIAVRCARLEPCRLKPVFARTVAASAAFAFGATVLASGVVAKAIEVWMVSGAERLQDFRCSNLWLLWMTTGYLWVVPVLLLKGPVVQRASSFLTVAGLWSVVFVEWGNAVLPGVCDRTLNSASVGVGPSERPHLQFLVPLALASAAAALLGWRLTGVLAPMKATDAVPPTAFDGA